MTDKFENIDPVLCDKLLSFIYPDESNMTDEDVQSEIHRLKIDMKPAIDKINIALNFYNQRQKAQEDLRIARENRPSLIDKIKQIKLPSFQSLRDEIQNRMQHLNYSLQSTYFRKLEESASEQDLKSLLEDILLLESLDKDSKNENQ
jgi:hypothetical protein